MKNTYLESVIQRLKDVRNSKVKIDSKDNYIIDVKKFENIALLEKLVIRKLVAEK